MENNLSIVQASKALGIKVRTVRQWIRDGKLKAFKYKCSNRWFIPEDEIQRVKDNAHDNIG